MTAGYDKLVVALKERLQAKILDAHGRETGFIRRLRTVGASDFVWAVVLSRFATGIPGFDRAREIFIQLSGTTISPSLSVVAASSERIFEECFRTQGAFGTGNEVLRSVQDKDGAEDAGGS